LDTRDEAEAKRLQAELNELLGDPRYHDVKSRADAARRFDDRVVDIFYHKMMPETLDFLALRDEAIPLPASEPAGYRRVLFLGTTGAGKTTLVRQLIGTDPEKNERFPSTSTAKTTVHDTEILLEEGPYRAAVTFVPSDEAREYLTECISAALLAAYKGESDANVLQKLLSHVNQRFRFNYILGNGATSSASDFDLDDDGDDVDDAEEDDFGDVDLDSTNELLTASVARLRAIALRLGNRLRDELVANEEDERVVEEIVEEELDNLLRDEDECHELADALMDEIEKRFELLPPGEVTKTRQGWPLIWRAEWPEDQRSDFFMAVSRFSSNYAPYFGRLLTPLVNGVRVAGPFCPTWSNGVIPKLVLLDGEGLGHTPKSSSSVSTAVSRRIEEADAVVLVDNAAQPMQAAPLAAMRELVSTGNSRKLVLAFTHFDQVKGDNLPNANAKAQHVLNSVENGVSAFGEELGPFAERALRSRLQNARVFLANMQETLSHDAPTGGGAIKQLQKLLHTIDEVIQRPEPVDAKPVYDKMNLALAIERAAKGFHESWRPRLGLESRPNSRKEHWTRVKALTRRLATGMADEYDNLRPVADLRKELVERIFVSLQNPVRWVGPEPSDDDEKQSVYEAFADNMAKRLLGLTSRRLWQDRSAEWQEAYDKHGTGSTFVRAKIIGNDIYELAAPIPDIVPSPDRNKFFREVLVQLEEASEEVGAQLE
jgi:energy-coupling factor transporter ATP-binding protein EcfA2